MSGVDDVYYVKSGDTISSIAMKFGINAKDLIELNKNSESKFNICRARAKNRRK